MNLSSEAPAGFGRYRNRAAMLLRSPQELESLMLRAARNLDAGSAGARFAAARAWLQSLLGLLRAFASGEYRQVSTRSLITIVGAVLYFVVPLDLVPDFLLGLGLIDDAAVIGYAYSVVSAELRDFESWRSAATGGC